MRNKGRPPTRRDLVQSTTRQPLFTNEGAAVGSERLAALIHPENELDIPQKLAASAAMPCRRENYILLEQSVTVDSKEVDALVTKIGEALQLQNNNGGGHQKTVSVSVSCLHGSGKPAPSLSGISAAAPVQKRHGCCMRLRSRGHRGSSRASPYHIPGSNGEQDWDQIRPWTRKRINVEEDDPHRLLQELILSGNLIKEAVRRLQFSAADCGDFPRAADNVTC
ncbi:glycogen synthase kinase binding protein [Mugil cephalus]|uniref:glycogen synthase kinase binding protein n=1 Tax=Mugil cephalus TaxID=48193 RepID=UPI001FB685CF|nr:glycogen synthase kinase binding protein [Mugil cephalus]